MNKKLQIIIFFVILIILWQIVVFIYAPPRENDLRIAVNGTLVDTKENAYLQGEPMVSLDWLTEIMDIQMEQDGLKRILYLDSNKLEIKLLSSEAKLNGNRYKLSNAVIYQKGKIFVPMRSVVEAFDWVVKKGPYGFSLYSPTYWAEKNQK